MQRLKILARIGQAAGLIERARFVDFRALSALSCGTTFPPGRFYRSTKQVALRQVPRPR
jgi:hypothetical protein